MESTEIRSTRSASIRRRVDVTTSDMRALTIDLGTIEATAWITIELAEREKEAEQRSAVTEALFEQALQARLRTEGWSEMELLRGEGGVTCAPPSVLAVVPELVRPVVVRRRGRHPIAAEGASGCPRSFVEVTRLGLGEKFGLISST